MNKTVCSGIIAILIVLLFSECKKGPGDPKFSLLTRKTRVTGKWHLTGGKAEIKVFYSGAWLKTEKSYVFDGKRYTLNYTGAGVGTYTATGVYDLNIHFDKNGSFTVDEDLDSQKLNANGMWDFSSGSGSEKKKESVIISLETILGGNPASNHFFTQGSMNFKYKIKTLKNKELVLTTDVPLYTESSEPLQSFKGEFVFTQ
jgi:hypothetical protein